jgi:hypothetical protein
MDKIIKIRLKLLKLLIGSSEGNKEAKYGTRILVFIGKITSYSSVTCAK